MRCPKCGGNKSSVIDSRQAEDGNTIRRRRECDECQYRFTTYERVEERTLVVVKRMARGNNFQEIRSLMESFARRKNVLFLVMRLKQLLAELSKKCAAVMKTKSQVNLSEAWLWKSWRI